MMIRRNDSRKLILFSVIVGLIGLLGSLTLVFAESGGDLPSGSPPAVTTGAAGSAAGSAAPGASAGIGSMLMPMLAFVVLFYFLMIRPQSKKMKEHQKLISEVKQGDEIVTSSGILGRITGLNEKVVTLEISDNVRIKLLKSQIAQVVKGPIKDLV